jgi:hypothetical protein
VAPIRAHSRIFSSIRVKIPGIQTRMIANTREKSPVHGHEVLSSAIELDAKRSA